MENTTPQTHSNDMPNIHSFKKSDSDALHSIMKTVEMALSSLEHLLSTIKDKREIVKYLKDQQTAYSNIKAKANTAFKTIGGDPEKINAFKDLMLKGSIKLNTTMDDSDSHIAEMMIEGTNMGIVEITKTLNEEKECLSTACISIAEEILKTMQCFEEDMKKFL